MKLTEVDNNNSISRNMLSGNLEGRTFNGVEFGEHTTSRLTEGHILYELGWQVPVTIKYTTAWVSGELLYAQNPNSPIHEFALDYLMVHMRTELFTKPEYTYLKSVSGLSPVVRDVLNDDFVTGLTTFTDSITNYITERWDTILVQRNEHYDNWLRARQ